MCVGMGGCACSRKVSELYLLSDSRGGCEGGVVFVENLRMRGASLQEKVRIYRHPMSQAWD